MKKALLTMAAAFCGLSTFAALPTLSELAARFETMPARYTETTNALAALVQKQTADADKIARLISLVESRKDLREAYHGGRLGQYVVTNDLTILRYDAYADGTIFTNTPTRVSLLDPEAAAKAKAEAEERLAAWERANLPAEIAAILQRRRDAANGKAGTP